MLSAESTMPGRLAFLFYKQLEEQAADDALLSQSTKNLVFLAPHLYSADLAAGRVPEVAEPAAGDIAHEQPSHTAADGSAAMPQGEDEGDKDAEPAAEDEDGAPGGLDGRALTLHGLVRRMARMADSRAWPHAAARLAALRFVAALGSQLGPDAILPYLPTLLVPLHRITEGGGAPNPDEVRKPPYPSA